jgi:hypothetical protein
MDGTVDGQFADAALRRVGLGHLAGGASPRGSPWNGCGWAAVTLNGVVNHAAHSSEVSLWLENLCDARR